MKTKIQAGATLDLINKDEMRDVLQTVTKDWFNQVGRGDRYRRFSAWGDISGGAVTIGGAEQLDHTLGPAEGFVWAVQRIGIHNLDSADSLALYINDDGPSALVHPGITTYQDFGQTQLVLYPGDTLLLTGSSLTDTGIVTVTGQARELPMPLAWRLGG